MPRETRMAAPVSFIRWFGDDCYSESIPAPFLSPTLFLPSLPGRTDESLDFFGVSFDGFFRADRLHEMQLVADGDDGCDHAISRKLDGVLGREGFAWMVRIAPRGERRWHFKYPGKIDQGDGIAVCFCFFLV